jgi:hypothetical protein
MRAKTLALLMLLTTAFYSQLSYGQEDDEARYVAFSVEGVVETQTDIKKEGEGDNTTNVNGGVALSFNNALVNGGSQYLVIDAAYLAGGENGEATHKFDGNLKFAFSASTLDDFENGCGLMLGGGGEAHGEVSSSNEQGTRSTATAFAETGVLCVFDRNIGLVVAPLVGYGIQKEHTPNTDLTHNVVYGGNIRLVTPRVLVAGEHLQFGKDDGFRTTLKADARLTEHITIGAYGSVEGMSDRTGVGAGGSIAVTF